MRGSSSSRGWGRRIERGKKLISLDRPQKAMACPTWLDPPQFEFTRLGPAY